MKLPPPNPTDETYDILVWHEDLIFHFALLYDQAVSEIYFHIVLFELAPYPLIYLTLMADASEYRLALLN